MRAAGLTRAGLPLLAVGALLSGCQRETRQLQSTPSDRVRAIPVRVSALQPGPMMLTAPVRNGYEGNAYAISEGERLYEWYHCSGCHSQGGGGIGPALMDSVWTYGGAPGQIYASIVQGRPNGMPSFGGHIPEAQVWEIVAFVRSLSGMQPKSATPSRSDHLPTRPDRR